MKLLDTTFLIDMVGGVKETEPILRSNKQLLTTHINMYEFIRGLFLRQVSSSRILEIMKLFDAINILPLDESGTVKAADISAQLIKGGQIIPDSDCLIAGIALSKNVSTIVTRNVDHFKRIKGVEIEKY